MNIQLHIFQIKFDQVLFLLTRKTGIINHVLIRFIKNWNTSLDRKNSIGAILMEVLNCIPLHAYRLNFNTVTFVNFYVKEQKQNSRINNICIDFQKLFQAHHMALQYVRLWSRYTLMTLPIRILSHQRIKTYQTFKKLCNKRVWIRF